MCMLQKARTQPGKAYACISRPVHLRAACTSPSACLAWLQSGLGKLPAGFASLGASRPWIVYWVTHSLALLGADLPAAGPAQGSPYLYPVK